MTHDLNETVSLLARMPAVLDALLRDMPDTWTLRNEGGDSWSAFDVVGHLIHAERTDWITRARMIVRFGETQTFQPFDRWAQIEENQGKSLNELLAIFARMRSESLDALRALNLRQADLERRGSHPSLGAVTLSQLLATWVVHDLTHLHQVSRLMAYQYRDAVGPWSKYLGVLACTGHSAAS